MTQDGRGRGFRADGFTLIEMLVVMVVIGILASIAIPVFLNQRQNAVGAAQAADLRSVANEVEAFLVSQGQYPDVVTQAGPQVVISSLGGAGTQRVTVGNTIAYRLNVAGDAYCLDAANPRAAGHRYWVSNAGGLQPTSTAACPF